MFNMLFEHLFVCHSLLKEQRRPPTGGLREAFEKSLGGGVTTPSLPRVGSKTTLGASEIRFPTRGKGLLTTLRGVAPIGAFPVGASFLIMGTMKGLILVGCETLSIFRGAFFEESLLPL